MKRLATATVMAVCVGSPVLAQPSAAPQVLPTTIIDPASTRPAGPLSPAEATKQRDALIAALKEDLRPIDPDRPDGRDLITTEPPTYALHLWDGANLVTHYERVSGWNVLASYTANLQSMIQHMFSERGVG